MIGTETAPAPVPPERGVYRALHPSCWSVRARITVAAASVVTLMFVGSILVHVLLAESGGDDQTAGQPAVDAAQHDELVRSVLMLMPVLILLTGLATWHAAGWALRPVNAITAGLRGVDSRDLCARIPVPRTNDEVAELAHAVNNTLARLERAIDRQHRFVADASHELRSPLTGLRAQLEVALCHPQDEDWPQVARAALADADRLQRIIGDLLALARLDADTLPAREPVELGRFAEEEARRRPRRVPVQVSADAGETLVIGDRVHLGRLLTNLLDNAARHAESEVRIVVSSDDDEAVVEIIDDGEGIAPADRERVFQRFTRLSAGQRRDAGGTGLGLPIARDIATAHGGSLVVGDSPRGARLVLRLPRAAHDHVRCPDRSPA